MKTMNYRRLLISLTRDKQAPSAYLANLYESFPIPMIDMDDLSSTHPNHETHYKILLIDFMESSSIINEVNQLKSASHQYEIVIVNVPYRLKTEVLLTLGNIRGLFYHHESMHNIETGLVQIIHGQNWLPRHVITQLLYYYRHHFDNQTIQAAITLTSRELQILRCLQTQASNLQIADSLFISEVTVKSHLYQIFKKISVRNRNQAILWANRNIVS